METQDLKENVLLNLRSVTQSCKGGVPFERLQRDYKDLLGSPIPFREMGYNSLESFIRDIPHVISLKKNNEGQLMAMGVADPSTAHIVSLVSRQKVDTKKRISRKPVYGARKPFSSRYTFREGGARGSHSRYTSSPPYAANSKSYNKPKPSKPSPPIQHSKPRAPVAQVPSRQYEIAPRFLKQKEIQNGSSSQEFIAPPAPQQSSASSSLSSNKIIPPPRPIGRSIPIKPQPLEITRTFQIDALESARTAKEFIEIYAKMKNLKPSYRTVLFGQKAKGYVSTLYLNDKSYRTYPDKKPTEAEAEEEAAKIAVAEIKERKEALNRLPETPFSNADEIRILLNRIEEIVCEKPSGMFNNGVVREYELKFNERLPSCWPELIKQSGCLEIEELKVEYGKVPDGVHFIVHPKKEISSGSRTPSSTSSKTEYVYEDLDTKTLKKTLANISLPKIPEFKIPTGNVWDVFITNITDSLSARIIDYCGEFLALSGEMKKFYESRKYPVTEVCDYQIYAACIEGTPDVWHRVIVDEIKENEVSCYFVDEGDISCVKKENLQEMNPDFLKLPFQAIHLTLEDFEDCEKLIKTDILEKHLLGQTLIAEVKRCYSIPDFFPEFPGINRTIYSIVLYDTSNPDGIDINVNELLKAKGMECLSCELPKLFTTTFAYLSHVTSDGCVYLRLTNPQVCWIEQELLKFSPNFEESSAATSKIPLNTMCAAKCESGTWHRAVVSESLHSSLDPEVVEVLFVDYGHVGVVGKSEICELEPISEILAGAPPQAISCRLSHTLPSQKPSWTQLETMRLMELAPFDQELIVRVMSEENGDNLAQVNLYKRNQNSEIISINESLFCNPDLFYVEPVSAPIKPPSMLPLRQNSRKNSLKSNLSGKIPDVAISAEEQMAKRLGTSLSPEKIEWLNTPDNIKSPDAFEVQSPASLSLPSIPEKGELFNVFVTMASHPHNFVVQPFDSSGKLDELTKDMKAFYSTEENLLEMDFSMLRKNDYYAALHNDGVWYRVRIEHIINGNPVLVAVHYVDFGDFNTVSIGRLQPLYQKFKELPCQAIKSSLAGIRPYNIDWDPVHCVRFQNMIKEKAFVSVVHKKSTEIQENIPSLHLELVLIDTSDTSKDVYIHEQLIERNIAKPQ